MKICLTNDDGADHPGLLKLASSLSKLGTLTVIVPSNQRSATGKALTLNSPIRISEGILKDNYEMIKHSGLPADSVVLAKAFMTDIDLVVAGINGGANLGYQSMLTSGTVGAVFEGAIMGIPGIAFSMVVEPHEWFNSQGVQEDYQKAAEIATGITEKVLSTGLPGGIDAINVNFPSEISDNTKTVVTKPAKARIENELDRRIDPNGSPYYWLRGIPADAPAGTDAHEVLQNGNISIAPIIIDTVENEQIEQLKTLFSL
ncbi:MAG: 5'/3'-nucleotidase SurE [Candidatus Thorarchaeota archaeon]|nr:5'/3'-nucleotidase SurE [Candidatus Thorarchaeota archaeon]